MTTEDRHSIERILAAGPLLAPDIGADRLAEIAPLIRAVLRDLAILDEIDLGDHEACLTLRLEPWEETGDVRR